MTAQPRANWRKGAENCNNNSRQPKGRVPDFHARDSSTPRGLARKPRMDNSGVVVGFEAWGDLQASHVRPLRGCASVGLRFAHFLRLSWVCPFLSDGNRPNRDLCVACSVHLDPNIDMSSWYAVVLMHMYVSNRCSRVVAKAPTFYSTHVYVMP